MQTEPIESSEPNRKLTIFYNRRTGEVEAFSEDKTIAALFELTRSRTFYIKKKVKLTGMQCGAFLFFHQDKMLFINVLSDGKKSFDFVTTYQEDRALTDMCNMAYDTLLELERVFVNFPCDDTLSTSIETLIKIRKEEEGTQGKFNTFGMFVEKFRARIMES